MEKDLRAHPRRCGGFSWGFDDLMGFCGWRSGDFWKDDSRLGTHSSEAMYCIRTRPRCSTVLHFSVTHCRSSIRFPLQNAREINRLIDLVSFSIVTIHFWAAYGLNHCLSTGGDGIKSQHFSNPHV